MIRELEKCVRPTEVILCAYCSCRIVSRPCVNTRRKGGEIHSMPQVASMFTNQFNPIM